MTPATLPCSLFPAARPQHRNNVGGASLFPDSEVQQPKSVLRPGRWRKPLGEKACCAVAPWKRRTSGERAK